MVPNSMAWPGPGSRADLLDVAPLLQRAHHAVDVDAADGRDLGPGDRLLVGDDRQRLEGGGRQPGALALEHEPLDVGRQVGVALEAVAAGHLDEHEAAALGLVGRGQLAAELLDRRRRGTSSSWASSCGGDRLLGDHQDRLDGAARGLAAVGSAPAQPS